jgi:hypothetical protein
MFLATGRREPGGGKLAPLRSRKNPLSDQYNAGNIKKRYRKREKNSGESQEKWVKMFV